MSLLPGQVRAARGFIGWSARELAEAACVGLSTVQRFESGGTVTPANENAIRAALEAAGVIFVDENGQGPGVRLRKERAR